MVAGSPCMCIRHAAAPLRASAASAPRACSARTSLIMAAPSATACSITSGRLVSTEMITSLSRATALTTGMTRRNSSSSGTGGAPGRVDSPPISTIAAPSAAMARARSAARAGSRYCPPSLKESGVTLSTPMTTGSVRSSVPRACRNANRRGMGSLFSADPPASRWAAWPARRHRPPRACRPHRRRHPNPRAASARGRP